MSEPAGFESVLFLRPRASAAIQGATEPACFPDLYLDQLVAAITAGREEFDLAPLLYLPAADVEEIRYRQDVARDLEADATSAAVREFADGMRETRRRLRLAAELEYRHEKHRWHLDAALAYLGAVDELRRVLETLPLASRGLRDLRAYLGRYGDGEVYRSLGDDARARQAELRAVRYALRIDGDRVSVLPYREEPDYSAEVQATFERFRRGSVRDYRATFTDTGRLNHVEARILEGVARLHPGVFAALERFAAEHAAFMDERVRRFDREVQCYLGYLELAARCRAAGLSFCYPLVSRSSKEVAGRAVFDLPLALTLLRRRQSVVPNDFALSGAERIMVVTGPNQGGKTTFARTVGQLHWLARVGLPVPGREVRLFFCDRIFTHFERAERPESLRGKLQDDLFRWGAILGGATSRSLVIINEIFASTTVHDALLLGRRVLEALERLDCLAVWVTFLDELAVEDGHRVSLVASVSPEDSTVRTFRLERRPADGLAYAHALGEKYRITPEWLRRRIGR
jgi:DNA mismatch repair protein MutS